jgi:hypothetical protein
MDATGRGVSDEIEAVGISSAIVRHLLRLETDHVYACSHHAEASRQYTERFEVYVREDNGQGEWARQRIEGHIVRALVALLSWVNEGNADHG